MGRKKKAKQLITVDTTNQTPCFPIPIPVDTESPAPVAEKVGFNKNIPEVTIVLTENTMTNDMLKRVILECGTSLFYHKFVINGAESYERNYILKSFMDFIYPLYIMPVHFNQTEKTSYFLARNCQDVIMKIISNRFQLPHHLEPERAFKIVILANCMISEEVPVEDNTPNILEVLEKRYNKETGMLDLSNFADDIDLNEYVPLSSPKMFTFILSQVLILSPKTVDLSNNFLKHIEPIEILKDSLQYLDLSNNEIETVNHLSVLIKCSKLRGLNLNGNPLCVLYDSYNYQLDVKRFGPKLEQLDGVTVKFPPDYKKNFMCAKDAEDLVSTFIEYFFTCYDSADRWSLKDLYSAYALFSVNSKIIRHQKNSGTTDLSHYGVENPYAVFGKGSILKLFQSFPKTYHDPYPMVCDVVFYSETHAHLVISGIFSENNQILSFNRSFYFKRLKQQFVILNDQLHVRNALDYQIGWSFTFPGHVKSTDTPLPYFFDQYKELEIVLQKLTRMNLEFCQKYLVYCNYDLKKALTLFSELHLANDVPKEAFTIQHAHHTGNFNRQICEQLKKKVATATRTQTFTLKTVWKALENERLESSNESTAYVEPTINKFYKKPPKVAPRVVPLVAPQFTPYVAPHVAPHIAPQVAPHIAPQIAPHVAPQIAPHVAPQIAQHVAHPVAPHIAPQVAPHVATQVAQASRHPGISINLQVKPQDMNNKRKLNASKTIRSRESVVPRNPGSSTFGVGSFLALMKKEQSGTSSAPTPSTQGKNLKKGSAATSASSATKPHQDQQSTPSKKRKIEKKASVTPVSSTKIYQDPLVLHAERMAAYKKLAQQQQQATDTQPSTSQFKKPVIVAHSKSGSELIKPTDQEIANSGSLSKPQGNNLPTATAEHTEPAKKRQKQPSLDTDKISQMRQEIQQRKAQLLQFKSQPSTSSNTYPSTAKPGNDNKANEVSVPKPATVVVNSPTNTKQISQITGNNASDNVMVDANKQFNDDKIARMRLEIQQRKNQLLQQIGKTTNLEKSTVLTPPNVTKEKRTEEAPVAATPDPIKTLQPDPIKSPLQGNQQLKVQEPGASASSNVEPTGPSGRLLNRKLRRQLNRMKDKVASNNEVNNVTEPQGTIGGTPTQKEVTINHDPTVLPNLDGSKRLKLDTPNRTQVTEASIDELDSDGEKQDSQQVQEPVTMGESTKKLSRKKRYREKLNLMKMVTNNESQQVEESVKVESKPTQNSAEYQQVQEPAKVESKSTNKLSRKQRYREKLKLMKILPNNDFQQTLEPLKIEHKSSQNSAASQQVQDPVKIEFKSPQNTADSQQIQEAVTIESKSSNKPSRKQRYREKLKLMKMISNNDSQQTPEPVKIEHTSTQNSADSQPVRIEYNFTQNIADSQQIQEPVKIEGKSSNKVSRKQRYREKLKMMKILSNNESQQVQELVKIEGKSNQNIAVQVQEAVNIDDKSSNKLSRKQRYREKLKLMKMVSNKEQNLPVDAEMDDTETPEKPDFSKNLVIRLSKMTNPSPDKSMTTKTVPKIIDLEEDAIGSSSSTINLKQGSKINKNQATVEAPISVGQHSWDEYKRRREEMKLKKKFKMRALTMPFPEDPKEIEQEEVNNTSEPSNVSVKKVHILQDIILKGANSNDKENETFEITPIKERAMVSIAMDKIYASNLYPPSSLHSLKGYESDVSEDTQSTSDNVSQDSINENISSKPSFEDNPIESIIKSTLKENLPTLCIKLERMSFANIQKRKQDTIEESNTSTAVKTSEKEETLEPSRDMYKEITEDIHKNESAQSISPKVSNSADDKTEKQQETVVDISDSENTSIGSVIVLSQNNSAEPSRDMYKQITEDTHKNESAQSISPKISNSADDKTEKQQQQTVVDISDSENESDTSIGSDILLSENNSSDKHSVESAPTSIKELPVVEKVTEVFSLNNEANGSTIQNQLKEISSKAEQLEHSSDISVQNDNTKEEDGRPKIISNLEKGKCDELGKSKILTNKEFEKQENEPIVKEEEGISTKTIEKQEVEEMTLENSDPSTTTSDSESEDSKKEKIPFGDTIKDKPIESISTKTSKEQVSNQNYLELSKKLCIYLEKMSFDHIQKEKETAATISQESWDKEENKTSTGTHTEELAGNTIKYIPYIKNVTEEISSQDDTTDSNIKTQITEIGLDTEGSDDVDGTKEIPELVSGVLKEKCDNLEELAQISIKDLSSIENVTEEISSQGDTTDSNIKSQTTEMGSEAERSNNVDGTKKIPELVSDVEKEKCDNLEELAQNTMKDLPYIKNVTEKISSQDDTADSNIKHQTIEICLEAERSDDEDGIKDIPEIVSDINKEKCDNLEELAGNTIKDLPGFKNATEAISSQDDTTDSNIKNQTTEIVSEAERKDDVDAIKEISELVSDVEKEKCDNLEELARNTIKDLPGFKNATEAISSQDDTTDSNIKNQTTEIGSETERKDDVDTSKEISELVSDVEKEKCDNLEELARNTIKDLPGFKNATEAIRSQDDTTDSNIKNQTTENGSEAQRKDDVDTIKEISELVSDVEKEKCDNLEELARNTIKDLPGFKNVTEAISSQDDTTDGNIKNQTTEIGSEAERNDDVDTTKEIPELVADVEKEKCDNLEELAENTTKDVPCIKNVTEEICSQGDTTDSNIGNQATGRGSEVERSDDVDGTKEIPELGLDVEKEKCDKLEENKESANKDIEKQEDELTLTENLASIAVSGNYADDKDRDEIKKSAESENIGSKDEVSFSDVHSQTLEKENCDNLEKENMSPTKKTGILELAKGDVSSSHSFAVVSTAIPIENVSEISEPKKYSDDKVGDEIKTSAESKDIGSKDEVSVSDIQSQTLEKENYDYLEKEKMLPVKVTGKPECSKDDVPSSDSSAVVSTAIAFENVSEIPESKKYSDDKVGDEIKTFAVSKDIGSKDEVSVSDIQSQTLEKENYDYLEKEKMLPIKVTGKPECSKDDVPSSDLSTVVSTAIPIENVSEIPEQKKPSDDSIGYDIKTDNKERDTASDTPKIDSDAQECSSIKLYSRDDNAQTTKDDDKEQAKTDSNVTKETCDKESFVNSKTGQEEIECQKSSKLNSRNDEENQHNHDKTQQEIDSNVGIETGARESSIPNKIELATEEYSKSINNVHTGNDTESNKDDDDKTQEIVNVKNETCDNLIDSNLSAVKDTESHKLDLIPKKVPNSDTSSSIPTMSKSYSDNTVISNTEEPKIYSHELSLSTTVEANTHSMESTTDTSASQESESEKCPGGSSKVVADSDDVESERESSREQQEITCSLNIESDNSEEIKKASASETKQQEDELIAKDNVSNLTMPILPAPMAETSSNNKPEQSQICDHNSNTSSLPANTSKLSTAIISNDEILENTQSSQRCELLDSNQELLNTEDAKSDIISDDTSNTGSDDSSNNSPTEHTANLNNYSDFSKQIRISLERIKILESDTELTLQENPQISDSMIEQEDIDVQEKSPSHSAPSVAAVTTTAEEICTPVSTEQIPIEDPTLKESDSINASEDKTGAIETASNTF